MYEVGDQGLKSDWISQNREDIQEIDALSITDSSFRSTLNEGKRRSEPSWGNLRGSPGGF